MTDRKTLQTKVSSTGYYTFDVPFLPKEDLNGLFYKKIARGSATYDENSGAIVELTDEKHNVVRLHMRELFRNLNVKVLTPEEELHGPTMQKQEPLYISCFPDFARLERLFPAVLKKQVGAGMISANIRNVVLDLKLKAPEKYAYLERILREETGFELVNCTSMRAVSCMSSQSMRRSGMVNASAWSLAAVEAEACRCCRCSP